MHLYFGDLHNHCGISYGHGTLDAASARARQQLDFCSVTGHAFWPDMPTDRARYAEVIDYHTAGFERLADQWDDVLATIDKANEPGCFVTFPSYEWHSREFGDQVVLLRDASGPLVSGETVEALHAALGERDHLIYPHHIGYPTGYRGVNWDAFDAQRSPLVEVYSLHGCSESDEAPYPMLHTMGPRDHASTAQAGLARGLRFAFAAGTDHHSAYPGSWGDGRVAVWAENLTREALWDAFRARRAYAVTGDRIEARLRIGDAEMGSEIGLPDAREIMWEISARHFVMQVELLRNNRVIATWNGPLEPPAPQRDPVRAWVRIEWGWGGREALVEWQAEATLSGGTLHAVEPCFRGDPILAPTEGHADEVLTPHAVLTQDETNVSWRSLTRGNPTTRHGVTQALLLDVEMRRADRLLLEVNGVTIEHPLDELLAGSRAHYLRGWLSEAVRVHRAVPAACSRLSGAFTDPAPERDMDWYYLRVAQRNDQWAWISPIWVTRSSST